MLEKDYHYAEEMCNGLTEAEKNRFNLLYLHRVRRPFFSLILSLFLGYLGIDRFYLGQIGIGFLKLFLNLLVIGFLWTIVDWFLILEATEKKNKETVDEIIVEIKK